ncbi:MAG: ABC transporter permease [Acidobacteria bacterium]|nr:ABC transporter permease [Acidobacteriota bacterium]
MIDHRENLGMAFETLIAHKFRSFLTILGIVVGILTVIVIASVLAGMRNSIATQIEDLGTNNIFAFHLNLGVGGGMGRRPREEMMRKPLTVADAQAIKEQCPSVADVSVRGMPFSTRIQVQYKGSTLRNAEFMAVSPNYGSVANVKIGNGRFFTESEDEHRMRVAVIGPDSAEAMMPNADPVGKQILIQGHPFTILGVAEKSKTGSATSETDNCVIIPYNTFRKMAPWEDNHLLFIQARSGMRSQAMDEVESLLRRRRGVKTSENNDFDLTTADRVIQQLDSVIAIIGTVAIAISSVGLLVGGIGVMNIMLVSVTERTREIGVRKALGATKKDIILQFLFEAMTLTGIGGIFGIIFAVAISYLIVVFVPDLPTDIPLWAVFTGLTVSVGIGLIFGVWPARKAAQLDPIEALRYE